MGFWNALSVLGPVGPALSDAQDIRTQRTQDAAKAAQEAESHKAQMLVQQLASQEAQQRIRAGTQPLLKPGSQPEFNPASGTYQQPEWVPDKESYVSRDVPGATPQDQEKYQLDSLKKNRAAAKEMMPDATPEQLDYLSYTLSGVKPPPAAKFTPLPGTPGQPQLGPDGKSYVVYGKDENSNIIAKPVEPGYKPPAPKPATSPAAIYTNMLAKQIMANKRQGPPLTPEEAAQLHASQSALTIAGVARAREMAEANAANRLYLVTDPDTGAEIAVPVSAGIAAFNRGTPLLAGTVGAPTGMDKKNQMLAVSAIQQVDRMENILRADPSLTGPGSGQLTRLQMWLGTQDPDAQQFLISSLLGSEHGVAVFGGRNVHTINDLNKALGDMKTNPRALTGALEVIKETMAPWVTAGGRLPAAGAAGGAGSHANPPKGKVVLHAGGKTYSILRSQVAEFKKDHPDARQ